MFDEEGNPIELTQEQIRLIESLDKQKKESELTAEQEKMLKSINLEDLQNIDLKQINNLLDSNGVQIPFQSKTIDRTNKRMYSFNYHANSDEYKNLGNLHKEKRVIEYFPQDDKLEFSTRPQIMGRNEKKYNYETGGLSYSQRIPKNLVGENLRTGRKETDEFNGQLMADRVSVAPSYAVSTASGFPKTTNQDFHGEEVFKKARHLLINQNKQNFKKANVYSAYVNAMFNSGVFTNPWQDQC